MRWEQGKELNRYVLGEPMEAWVMRKDAWRKCLPLVAVSLVLVSEMVLMGSWKQERSAGETIGLLLMGNVLLILLMIGSVEAQAASFRHSKRSAEVSDKGLRLSPTKRLWLAWESISHVHFEPVPGLPEAARVTFVFRPVRGRRLLGEWSMVLASRDQQETLLTALRAQRNQHQLDLKIFQHPHPLPARSTRRLSPRPLWAIAAGWLLLIHGMPCLLFGLMMPADGSGSSPHELRMTPHREQQLREFVRRHFSTVQEFNQTLVVAGIILTVPGALLTAYGMRRMTQQSRAWAAEQASDNRALAEQAGVRI